MIVIYHADCVDGFCSAFLLHLCYGDGVEYVPHKYVPHKYGMEPLGDESVINEVVYIVDFSFNADVLVHWSTLCKKLVVLDHHKTALHVGELISDGIIEGVFDLERSGARLTYDWLTYVEGYCLEDEEELVNYVQDRDLWKFELENSEWVNLAIQSYPMTFESWCSMPSISTLELEGGVIERYKDALIAAHVKEMVVDDKVTGDLVPYVTCSCPQLVSELGNIVSMGYPYAIIDNSRGGYSLRSQAVGGVDVSVIAKRFGGGGHKHAAGFILPGEGV